MYVVGSHDASRKAETRPQMMLGMMVLFIASYALGLGSIPWQCTWRCLAIARAACADTTALGAELFPLELRGVGASLLSSGIWVCLLLPPSDDSC